MAAGDVEQVEVATIGNEVIVPGPELTKEICEKKLKAVRKEGGKKGVEIEGAADMGGLQFFCTTLETPNGDLDLLIEAMKAMNAISDPSEEERKGGAGKIGKVVLNVTDDVYIVVAYVPKHNSEKCNATEWLKYSTKMVGGSEDAVKACEGVDPANYAVVSIAKDGEKGLFPIKMRDTCITESYSFLKKRGLFPDGDDDDDEMVFGDDDFP